MVWRRRVPADKLPSLECLLMLQQTRDKHPAVTAEMFQLGTLWMLRCFTRARARSHTYRHPLGGALFYRSDIQA